MLSKKMAFSLMSLITIFAFALVAVPVMAADDFGGSISFSTNVRAADIIVTVTFEENVGLTNAQAGMITVQRIDANGNLASDTVTGDTATSGDLTGITALAIKDTDPDTTGDQTDGKAFMFTIPASVNTAEARKITVVVLAGDSAVKTAALDDDKSSKLFSASIDLVASVTADPDAPKVISITRAVPIGTTLASAFIEQVVTGPFQVKIVLSEQPKEFKAANLSVSGAEEVEDGDIVAGVAIPRTPATGDITNPPAAEGGYTATGEGSVPEPTGSDSKYYPYLVTITPDGSADKVVIKVKEFENNDPAGFSVGAGHFVGAKKYVTPTDAVLDGMPNGRQRLTVTVKKDDVPLGAGYVVELTNKRVIPANGYLIVANTIGSTGIHLPTNNDADDNAPKATERTPAELLYNAISVGTFPDLESFLSNGGTIDLVAPDAGIRISEIMWGSDASLETNSHSQWIEIQNFTDGALKTGDKTYKLVFYGINETLPDMSDADNNIQDRVGTIGEGGRWSLANKGQSGRTGTGEQKLDFTAVVPTQEIISMQRVITEETAAVGAVVGDEIVALATGTATVISDGTLASGWVESVEPALNFDPVTGGNRVGTPGSEPDEYPEDETLDPVPDVPAAMPEDIVITEIMVDTGGGRLPQWIELANISGAEVSLDGWSLMITNSEDDADVVGSSLNIDLSGIELGVSEHEGNTGKGKTLLLVGGTARSSSNLSDSMDDGRIVDVSDQLDQTGRYTFISTMAFMLALIPPQETGVLTYGDTAGNLGADEAWEIPMDEMGRSSLIRREMDKDAMATMGTAANGWVLASSTALVSGPTTWYGSDEDAGTPGYDNGGPLPVELSHFRPARDKATGAVVITWSTQSELNNAGFFIKRSQQRDGQFKVINATMIAGAGTTSEKQFYTYTDTTAQPNVVYYYQIEDVSLDGNRQTLTNGIRLKGHIGAAGKLTTTWGDLKTSNE